MTGPTLAATVDEYVADRVSRGEITAVTGTTHLWRIKKLVDSFGPDRPIAELDKAAVKAWQRSIGTQSPASRRSYVSSVKTFCRWAVLEGYLEADPTLGVGRVREPKKVPRALSAEKVARLLEWVHDDLRATAVVWLMVGCGLRCVEVCRLNVDDYDPAARLIHVNGKAGNERVLPVPDPVARALGEYLAGALWTSGALLRTRNMPRGIPGAPVCSNPACGRTTEWRYTNPGRFCSACRSWMTIYKELRPLKEVQGHRMNRHHLSTWVTKLMEQAGIKGEAGDGVSAHALRHTCASDALDRCHDVRTVQALLGHASLTSTQIYLRRANLDQLRDAMSADGSEYTRQLT